MRAIICITIFTLPLYIVGIFIDQKFISHSHILAVMIAILGLLNMAKPQYKGKRTETSWSTPFILFLVISVIGLIVSPFGIAILEKGLIQIIGITVMLIMVFSIVHEIRKQPRFFITAARLAMISLGIFASIGIVQFILWNLTPWSFLINFSFLNDLAGGIVWRDTSHTGGIYRANSLTSEPSHFVRYLGFGLGIAFIRVGMFGNQYKQYISTVFPLWSAWAIIIGTILSVSILGWGLMLIIAIMLFLLLGKLSARQLIMGIVTITVLGILLIYIAMQTEGIFFEKLQSLSFLFVDESIVLSKNIHSQDLSALVINYNYIVAKENFISQPLFGGGLGSHSLAAVVFLPSYVYLFNIPILNTEDAASLLLRLISETGLLGLCLFMGGIIWIIMRARQVIKKKMNAGSLDDVLVVSIGILASGVGVFSLYFGRTGHYYDPVFWVLIAMVVAIPMVLKVRTVRKQKYFITRRIIPFRKWAKGARSFSIARRI